MCLVYRLVGAQVEWWQLLRLRGCQTAAPGGFYHCACLRDRLSESLLHSNTNTPKAVKDHGYRCSMSWIELKKTVFSLQLIGQECPVPVPKGCVLLVFGFWKICMGSNQDHLKVTEKRNGTFEIIMKTVWNFKVHKIWKDKNINLKKKVFEEILKTWITKKDKPKTIAKLEECLYGTAAVLHLKFLLLFSLPLCFQSSITYVPNSGGTTQAAPRTDALLEQKWHHHNLCHPISIVSQQRMGSKPLPCTLH